MCFYYIITRRIGRRKQRKLKKRPTARRIKQFPVVKNDGMSRQVSDVNYVYSRREWKTSTNIDLKAVTPSLP